MKHLKRFSSWLVESDIWSTVGPDDEDDRTRKIRQIIQLSKSSDSIKREKAIRSPLTPAAVLIKLSDDHSEWVRVEVAAHKNTPGKVLDKLSKDKSEFVLAEVAKNVKTPKSTLAHLSRSDSLVRFPFAIRKKVVNNPNTSLETIIKLSRDPDERIRNLAQERLDDIKNRAIVKGEADKLARIEELESMSDLGIHGDVEDINLDDLDI